MFVAVLQLPLIKWLQLLSKLLQAGGLLCSLLYCLESEVHAAVNGVCEMSSHDMKCS